MTQEADHNSVVGVFDGRELDYLGIVARPIERDGGFAFQYLEPGGQRVARTFPVVRTVGSRRYQQYLTRVPEGDDTYFRVHWLWHIEDQRWVHLNGAFLGPDEQRYDDHVAVWDHNCIFCHNTGPEPGIINWDDLQERRRRGEAVDSANEARYRSEVAELGVACATCHGPGGDHASRNRNPFRRYLLHWSGRDDPTIAHPAKLDHERSTEICGQCHGQRIPENLEMVPRWVSEGPTYRAGDALADHVRPLAHDTQPFPGAASDIFALRFWADGTPRLTAYEYQGLTQSPCFQKGELSCIHCHSMHGGDVFGQLPPENRTAQACLPCHEDLVRDVSVHTHHEPESSGSNCYNCHMPKMVYGIMEIHRSHRIENPDPAHAAKTGRPDACTSCHLDRSPRWAAEAARAWWGDLYRVPDARLDGADPILVDSVASLLGGDPVQRAVAARLIGSGDSALTSETKVFLVPALLLAMDDGYPAVRRFAHKSLKAIQDELGEAALDLGPELRSFDFMAPAGVRARTVARLRERWTRLPKERFPTPPPNALLDAEFQLMAPEVLRLRQLAMARSKTINIGE